MKMSLCDLVLLCLTLTCRRDLTNTHYHVPARFFLVLASLPASITLTQGDIPPLLFPRADRQGSVSSHPDLSTPFGHKEEQIFLVKRD